MNADKILDSEEWKIINCLDWLQDTRDIVEIPDLQVLDPSIEKTYEEPHQTDLIQEAFSLSN
jgi:hypothetical protein